MEESDTYLAIVEEGQLKEVKRILLRQGQRRFGPATDEVRTALEGIADIDRLERMTDRVFDATNWEELLATP